MGSSDQLSGASVRYTNAVLLRMAAYHSGYCCEYVSFPK